MRLQLNGRVRALTLVEVLVIVVLLVLFATLVMFSGRNPRHGHSPVIRCLNHLKQVGLAFRLFADDHADRFPMQVSTNEGGSMEFANGGNAWCHYLTLSNELFTPKILVCPADKRSEATNFAELRNKHLSYFVGLDARTNYSQVLLAGDRNITNTAQPINGIMVLTTNQTATRGAGWTEEMHQHAGNVVLTDGSVQQLSVARLREQLRMAETNSQHIATP